MWFGYGVEETQRARARRSASREHQSISQFVVFFVVTTRQIIFCASWGGAGDFIIQGLFGREALPGI